LAERDAILSGEIGQEMGFLLTVDDGVQRGEGAGEGLGYRVGFELDVGKIGVGEVGRHGGGDIRDSQTRNQALARLSANPLGAGSHHLGLRA
jgi:hypothetical protein